VSISVAGLQEDLEGLANELVARIAGQGPETFVGVTDQAVLVDEGYPFGYSLEQVF